MVTLPTGLRRAESPLAQSLRVWVALLGVLACVQLFTTTIGAGLERDPRSALFGWPAIAIVGAAGLIGIWLSHRTGFPAPTTVGRWAIPMGVGIGLTMAAGDVVFGWTRYFAAQHTLETFNVPFPGSVLFYTGGAIISEVWFRLLPIPLLLWLVSQLVLRGRAETQVFWILAVLTSFIEPVLQDLLQVRPETLVLALTQFIPDYGLNFGQAVLFRRYGFPAAIVMRVALYLVWHVAYGNFICRC
jgi:hypothetical protein